MIRSFADPETDASFAARAAASCGPRSSEPPAARLTRYFGMSDGFFLRLQNAYDLEEVERREGAALDRIVPRAA